MLKIATYTKQELVDIFHTTKMCNITRSLDSMGYEYVTNGRKGDNYRLTITKTPNNFKTFCINELGIPERSNFRILKEFFYLFFCDEEFQQMPITEMVRILKSEGEEVSRQTIAKWIQFLRDKNIIFEGNEFNYFATVVTAVSTETFIITQEEYLKAWKVYWDTRREGGSSEEAFRAMRSVNGGAVFKKPKVLESAFYTELIDALVETIEKE